MTRRRRTASRCASTILGLLLGGLCLAPGVRADAVLARVPAEAGSAAEGGPFRPAAGDRVVGWRSVPYPGGAPRSGSVTEPLDLLVPLATADSSAALWLRVERGGEAAELEWPAELGLDAVGPPMTLEETAALASAVEEDPRPAAWLELRDAWESRGRRLDAVWLSWRLADRSRRLASAAEAVDARREVLARLAGLPQLVALAHQELARDLMAAGRIEEAEAAHDEAVRQAGEQHPGSLMQARSLHLAAALRLRYGRSREALAGFEQARDLRRRLAPGSPPLAATLNNLGLTLADLGRADEGEASLRSALAIRLRLQPNSPRIAGTYNNLGGMAYQRGDLAGAERYYRRAVELRRRASPDSLHYARSLNNLAGVVETLGDVDKAEQWYRESLELRRRLDPDGPEITSSLANLATLLLRRGDAEAAIDYARQASRHSARVAAGSEFEAWAGKILSHVLLAAGRAEEAVEPARDGVEIYGQLVGDTVELADARGMWGLALLEAGRPEEARGPFERALEARRRLAPESSWEAESWRLLGRLELAAGAPELAKAHYRRAFDIVERLTDLPGRTPRERAERATSFVDWYREAVQLWAAQGEPAQAFFWLERARARGLTAMLAERSIRWDDELPAEDLAERRRLAAAYEEGRSRLAALDSGEEDARRELMAELNRLRDERGALSRELRSRSPRLAAVEAPRSFDWPRVARGLAEDTALLAYSVGVRETWLFAGDATPSSLTSHHLPVTRDELSRKVTSLLLLLRSPSSQVPEIRRQAAELYQLLMAPAAEALRGKRRIVVVADRSLHRLPFPALVRADGTWLAESLAVVLAPSATFAVTRRLPRGRTGDAAGPLLTFADPLLDQPLPWSRLEASAIVRSARSRGQRAEAWIGAEASEETFKAEAPRASRLHIATHATVDDLSPLDSHFRLAPSTGLGAADDGRVRAWEIFEQVRLTADLVTLSGCETGLGRELEGEGLDGLVRAFLFAGARSVVASKWRVEDRATAALMDRFYAGLSGDAAEALRRAQVGLASGPVALPTRRGALARLKGLLGLSPPATADLRHPYYWAGFELTGDWRQASSAARTVAK